MAGWFYGSSCKKQLRQRFSAPAYKNVKLEYRHIIRNAKDILDKTESFELGYDYLECGICKLCKDEGCPELAKYLCQLDFVLADIMGMKLERTMTLAEGSPKCDFRYSKK